MFTSIKFYSTLVSIISIFLLAMIPTSLYSTQREIDHDDVIIVEEVTLKPTLPTKESIQVSHLLTKEVPSVQGLSEEISIEETPQPIFEDIDSLLSPSNVTLEELESALKYELVPLASCFLHMLL